MLGSLIGGLAGAAASIFGAKSNADAQKDFAKKGIQWKVADSLKAGIHPLYGLGANTHSFAPSNVGGELASTFSSMGQDIDRSRMAASESGPRGIVQKLALERAGLENDLLRAQINSEIRRSSPPHVGPAMPSILPPSDMAAPFVNPWNGSLIAPPSGTSSAQTLTDNIGDGIGDILGSGNYFKGQKIGQSYYKGVNMPPGSGWWPSFSLRWGPSSKKYYDRIPSERR